MPATARRTSTGRLAWHAAHVLVVFAVTLGGMLQATHQPVTKDLVLSLLPAAGAATLRALEARGTRVKRDNTQRASGPAQSST